MGIDNLYKYDSESYKIPQILARSSYSSRSYNTRRCYNNHDCDVLSYNAFCCSNEGYSSDLGSYYGKCRSSCEVNEMPLWLIIVLVTVFTILLFASLGYFIWKKCYRKDETNQTIIVQQYNVPYPNNGSVESLDSATPGNPYQQFPQGGYQQPPPGGYQQLPPSGYQLPPSGYQQPGTSIQ